MSGLEFTRVMLVNPRTGRRSDTVHELDPRIRRVLGYSRHITSAVRRTLCGLPVSPMTVKRRSPIPGGTIEVTPGDIELTQVVPVTCGNCLSVRERRR
jgi:hypothetical protein